KGLLDRGLRRPVVAEHGGEPFMDREQPDRQRQIARRFHRAAADKGQPVAFAFNDAPAGAAQARVDAEDTDGLANGGGGHGVVIAPQRRERNINRRGNPAFPVIASEAKQSITPQVEEWIASSLRSSQ